jgi:hypothetical protein
MRMPVYKAVTQQRFIPRCHGNVLSEALPSRWSYSGRGSLEKKILAVSLKGLGAKTN